MFLIRGSPQCSLLRSITSPKEAKEEELMDPTTGCIEVIHVHIEATTLDPIHAPLSPTNEPHSLLKQADLLLGRSPSPVAPTHPIPKDALSLTNSVLSSAHTNLVPILSTDHIKYFTMGNVGIAVDELDASLQALDRRFLDFQIVQLLNHFGLRLRVLDTRCVRVSRHSFWVRVEPQALLVRAPAHSNLTEAWINGQLSTLDYLLWINEQARRTRYV